MKKLEKFGSVYRKHFIYNLQRYWDRNLPIATVILSNPNYDMDGQKDDFTIRKLYTLLGNAGFGGFDLVFIYPIRLVDDTFNPGKVSYSLANEFKNIDNIEYYLNKNETTICAWGSDDRLNMMAVPILYSAIKKEKDLQCFGIGIINNYPKKPGRLHIKTPLIPYRIIN